MARSSRPAPLSMAAVARH